MLCHPQRRPTRAAYVLGCLALAVATQGLAQGNASTKASASLAPVLKQVMPSVVNLMVQGKVPWSVQKHTPSSKPGPRLFRSVGSGVVIDGQHGYIVTNAHVVHHGTSRVVTLHDGRHLLASLVGMDPSTDLAVLQVHEHGLKAIQRYSKHPVHVGDRVIAIGNPFGLQQSVTSGIVSGLHRHVGLEGVENFIQTDAPINPGNSGGALINHQGALVGINTAILGGRGGNIGIGFAIPIHMVNPIVAQLIKHGNVQRGRLGVVAQDLTPSLASALGVGVKVGALVSQVTPGSTAEHAGLRSGDVITAINDVPTTSASEMRSMVSVYRAGEPMHVDVQRVGHQHTLHMTARPSSKHHLRAVASPIAGLVLKNFDAMNARSEHVTGVEVTEVTPGTSAWLSGLRPHDVILRFNHQRVHNLPALLALLHHPLDARVLMVVLRGQSQLFMTLSTRQNS